MAEREGLIRILVVDDHQFIRFGVSALVDQQDDMSTVAVANDGESAIAAVAEHRPDVAVVDIELPDMSGLDALQRMGQASPDTRFLVLSVHHEPEYIRAALEAGATGYTSKTTLGTALLTAIRHVHPGGVYVQVEPPPSGQPVTAPPVRRKDDLEGRLQGLSARELEVLRYIAEGQKYTDIADELGISERTIATYRRRISQKTGLPTRSAIIRAFAGFDLAAVGR